jgi:hypothetical protein
MAHEFETQNVHTAGSVQAPPQPPGANGEPTHRAAAPPAHGTKAAERAAQTAAPPKGGSAFFNLFLASVFGAVAGTGGAWAFLNYLNPRLPEPVVHVLHPMAAPASNPSSEASTGTASTPAPAAGVAPDEFKDLAGKVDHLCDRLDRLQDRMASIPKPEPQPDTAALADQIVNQVKADPAVAMVPARLAAITDRVANLEQTEAALRAAVESLGKPIKKPEGSPPGAPSQRGPQQPSSTGDPAALHRPVVQHAAH